MKKYIKAMVVWLMVMLVIVTPFFLVASDIYGPTRFFGDVSVGTWGSVTGISVRTSTGGGYTNGTWTNTYRVSGLVGGGAYRLPIGTNVEYVIAGNTNSTNSVILSWRRFDGITNYVIERSWDAGVTWTNWDVAAPSVTNWTDRRTNAWRVTDFSNDYSVVPSPSVPWGAGSDTNEAIRIATNLAIEVIMSENFWSTNGKLSGLTNAILSDGTTVDISSLLGGGGGDASTWSQYPATQDADMAGYGISNVTVIGVGGLSGGGDISVFGRQLMDHATEHYKLDWINGLLYSDGAGYDVMNWESSALLGTWSMAGGLITTNAGAAGAGYYAMSNGVWTLFAAGGGGGDTNAAIIDATNRSALAAAGLYLPLAGGVMTGDSVTLTRDVQSRQATSVGIDAAAFGNSTVAEDYAAAFGFETTARQLGAAFGSSTTAGTNGAAFGQDSIAGAFGFAAGIGGRGGLGSFVFADKTTGNFDRTATSNEFAVRAAGGVYLATPVVILTNANAEVWWTGGGSYTTKISGTATSITMQITGTNIYFRL